MKADQHLGLLHLVTGRIHRRLGHLAEYDEMLAEGTIGLMEACESYQTEFGVTFAAFAVPRIRGAIYDMLRRDGLKATEYTPLSDEIVDPFPLPDAGVSADSDRERMWELIGALPERERVILLAYYLKQQKQQQIAADLGLTEGRVSQIRTKTLAKLREQMAA